MITPRRRLSVCAHIVSIAMEMLGHNQVSLTLNTHTHVLPALQREAAEKIDAVLLGS